MQNGEGTAERREERGAGTKNQTSSHHNIGRTTTVRHQTQTKGQRMVDHSVGDGGAIGGGDGGRDADVGGVPSCF